MDKLLQVTPMYLYVNNNSAHRPTLCKCNFDMSYVQENKDYLLKLLSTYY